MNAMRLASVCALLTVLSCGRASAGDPAGDNSDPALAAAVNSSLRTADFRDRDPYQHPYETLQFFGLREDMTVVEVWPGEGWFAEIIAPFLAHAGHYYAATAAASLPDASWEVRDSVAAFKKKFGDSARYGEIGFSEFRPPLRRAICPPGTADLILSFRAVHNWITGGYEQDAFEVFYVALKPGGVLGIVENRAKEYTTLDATRRSGYVNEAYVKALAANAGFEFVGESDVNNNPRDTKDYPRGVWTLPPTLEMGDENRDHYLAIGEADRMTLKFRKPAGAGTP